MRSDILSWSSMSRTRQRRERSITYFTLFWVQRWRKSSTFSISMGTTEKKEYWFTMRALMLGGSSTTMARSPSSRSYCSRLLAAAASMSTEKTSA